MANWLVNVASTNIIDYVANISYILYSYKYSATIYFIHLLNTALHGYFRDPVNVKNYKWRDGTTLSL